MYTNLIDKAMRRAESFPTKLTEPGDKHEMNAVRREGVGTYYGPFYG
jgi:hypothetical protein